MARIVMHNAGLGLQGMVSEHERDTRSWRLDWHSIPESSIMTAKAIQACIWVVEGLDINEKRITANLDMLHGMLFSEALMFHLGAKVGKQTAHHLLRDAVLAANTGGKTFKELILDNKEIGKYLSVDELDSIMDYNKHIGMSVEQVEAVLRLSETLGADDLVFL